MDRLFGKLVGLYPRGFREELGEQLRETLARRAADARRRGARAWLKFVLREPPGLVRAALMEHVAEWRDRSARRSGPRRERRTILEASVGELRTAARRLARTPAFTSAAVLTLALAIGANTAIFALLNRVVLAPLPYPHAERLVVLDHAGPGIGLEAGMGMSNGLYREYATVRAVEAIGLLGGGEGTLIAGSGAAERLPMLAAMPSVGALLGATPLLGRWFTEAEGAPGGPNVVVLTHGLWVRRFGADPAVVGTTVRIDGRVHEVIGVLPAGFTFPGQRPEFVTPFVYDPASARAGGFGRGGVARVREGHTVADLKAQLDAVIADLPARFPNDPLARAAIEDVRLAALPKPLKEVVVGDVARMIWVMLGSVAVVLFIACANLANLFLVRADARQREVAVRRALGAGTGRVGGFFLAETLLVAALGCALGLALAWAGVRVLGRYSPLELPRLHEVSVDATAVAWAVLLSLGAAVAFGLLPLLRGRINVAAVLQDSGRGNTAGGARMRARHILMAAQLSLAMMLLVAAGLLLQSFQRMRTADPGFDSSSRLIFQIALPPAEYPDYEAAAGFQEQLLARLRTLPGARDAALTTTLPLQIDGRRDVLETPERPLATGELNAVAEFRRVSANYFELMRIPLIRGRAFTDADMQGTGAPVLIDDALARAYFADSDPIGRQIRPIGADDGWHTVVGVVGTTPVRQLREPAPSPHIYFPLRSASSARTLSLHIANLVVVTDGEPLGVLPGVRRALAELDGTVAIARPERMTDLLARTGARTTFTMVLMVIAATMALLLGMIGAYAVISYGVAQRREEIGVRLALGARPADVSGMIIRQSVVVIVTGIALGLAGAFAGGRALEALLFDIAWNDTLTYVVVATGLFVVGLLASWVPASRAARVSPLESLR